MYRDLVAATELDVSERPAGVPVLDGPQVQGDLIVIPVAVALVAGPAADARWRDVPPKGALLLRGEAARPPHTLVAEPDTCRWTTAVFDAADLAVAAFATTAVVYLLHPEHEAIGCAPGTYVVRRRREHTPGVVRMMGFQGTFTAAGGSGRGVLASPGTASPPVRRGRPGR